MAWLQVPRLVEGAEYKLLKEHAGLTFFDGWKFFDARTLRVVLILHHTLNTLSRLADLLNNGDVEYVQSALVLAVSLADAFFSRFIGADESGDPRTSLAYVDPATNRAILKVDNTNVVPYNEKRKSVRITSEDAYDFGTVFVADIHHFPYGVSLNRASYD
jgi:hypothetical protein